MKLGEIQKLQVLRKTDFGVYLGDDSSKMSSTSRDERPAGRGRQDRRNGRGQEKRGGQDRDGILLPKKEVPPSINIGDEIEVFVYLDSEDRPIATTRRPKLVMDELSLMTVKDVTKIGAFLDWGLEKDLFLPFREQTGKVKTGEEVLARLYTDKSGRLAASMRNLHTLLRQDSPYEKDAEVTGRVYEFGHDFGTFIAVDDIYAAMIPKHENTANLRIGELVELRVIEVKPDGKLDVTQRKKAYAEIPEDAEALLQLIESYGGVLPFTEKASPEVIFRETGLSKAAFKRAIGRLYKERKITLDGGKIRMA